jgi:hypothetical protein
LAQSYLPHQWMVLQVVVPRRPQLLEFRVGNQRLTT